jgi:putative transposase
MRTTQFFEGGYFHVYNRGVDKRAVFLRYGQYLRFVQTIRLILFTGSATPRLKTNQSLALNRKVRMLSYCLMPNHYHFLLQEIEEGGITEFMHKLDTSYTKYFNMNTHRSGRLFEYTFKAKTIESDDLLLHISRYIHLNPVIANLVEKPEEWKWSSYREYIDIESSKFCDTSILEYFFKDIMSYKKFVTDQIEYAKMLKDIEEVKHEDALFL